MSSANFSFSDHSHRRFNPLTGSWVLCSPHRAKRPWLGQVEEAANDQQPEYDPKCYLCPGNKRAAGTQNENYISTYVFTNDYAAVHSNQPECSTAALKQVTGSSIPNELFRIESTRGQCKVVCFSPRHDLTLPELSINQISQVVRTWQDIFCELSADPNIGYIQIFENKGAMMGCSNPHPHGQVWALSVVPSEPAAEIASFKAFHQKHAVSDSRACLLCSYVYAEKANSASESANRVLLENETFIVVVPFWAVWPFETMIVAKLHISHIGELSQLQIQHLAEAMQVLTIRYDNIFQCSFPYSMGFHQSPTATHVDAGCCHLHLHFYPPLLRNATVRKFLVGFEMMAEPQRDFTAEQAAAQLRSMESIHYKHRPHPSTKRSHAADQLVLEKNRI